MDALPPIVIACVALAYVMVWQIVGTCLLAPILRWGGLSRGYSLIVSWLVFMPLVGCLALVLALGGVATPGNLRLVTGILAASGVASLIRARHRILSLTRSAWQSIAGRTNRLATLLGLGVLALHLVFAGHPQRLYDQLNYHLVAGKRVLAYGGLTAPIFDPHLFIAGPIEYAMLWPRALWSNDLLQVGVGQVWVFVATVFPILAAVLLLCRKDGFRSGVALAALAAVPALLPDNEMFNILKPGAFLFAGTFIAMLAPCSSRRLFTAVALPFVLLFTACNPTYVHASIALVVAAVAAERAQVRALLRASPLLWLGAAALAVSFYKSWTLTKTLLYPSDAPFLGSPMADETTFAYWHSIAFSTGEPFWRRWWGAVQVPSQSRGLAIWLLLLVPVVLHLVATKAKSGWSWRGPRLPLVFALAFALIWPLFYDSAIYTRFVASYVGALLAFGFTVLIRTEGALRQGLVIATTVLPLSVSHADVMVRKIHDWNQGSAFAAYVTQFPRIAGSVAVNEWARETDSVLADDNGKFFFDAAVLTGTLSPDERKTWADLLTKPQDTARAIRLKAIVVAAKNRDKVDGGIPFAGPINEVWARLAAFGTEVQVGTDMVLKSECFFTAKPCPGLTDAKWTSNSPSH